MSEPVSPSAAERLLSRWIGLDVGTVGPAAVDRAVRTRMTATGEADAAAYAARAETDEAERDALVEEVVVGESWFFRDPQVFEFVARLAATLAALPGRAPVRVLSAPCAAGEEPYSVAMALFDAGLSPGQFAIDAIDVSRVALSRALRGRYSPNAFRNADLSFRERWFHATDAGAVIDDRVRAQVAFAWGNLLDESFRAGRERYDVIFCRNLLIYLGSEARISVERQLDALLEPDGVLVLGAAEPPIMRGGWIPAGGASVFALRRGIQPAPPAGVPPRTRSTRTIVAPPSATPRRPPAALRTVKGTSSEPPPRPWPTSSATRATWPTRAGTRRRSRSASAAGSRSRRLRNSSSSWG